MSATGQLRELDGTTENQSLEGLRFVRPLCWDEVWSVWRSNEIDWPETTEHFQKRGFTSWEAWRTPCAQAFQCDRRTWRLYDVADPLVMAPTFYGGPFPFWQRMFYGDCETLSFAELAALPGVRQDWKIAAIRAAFPSATTLVGLHQRQRRVVVVDGMHRCCALAWSVMERRTVATAMNIALATFDEPLPAFA
jgi:hypothetical protein